ncbi:Mannose-specific lectin [Fusarium oxysporum f. sp. albedinis]|nr:Mannose-specific lectin [Fusarium oxysporum f. sp. albedinis]
MHIETNHLRPSSLSSSDPIPTSITDSTSPSTSTPISASVGSSRVSSDVRASARVMNLLFAFATASLFFPRRSWAIYSSGPVICPF